MFRQSAWRLHLCVPVMHSSWSAGGGAEGAREAAFVSPLGGADAVSQTSAQLTYTVVLALDVFEVVALLALAEVAAEGVHALPVVRAKVLPSNTFVNI